MSSAEEDQHEYEDGLPQGLKKRRVQRACDICRRKKGTVHAPPSPAWRPTGLTCCVRASAM